MKGNQMKRELRIVAEQFWPIFFVQMMSHITLSVGNTINGLVIGNALSPIALAALGLVNPSTDERSLPGGDGIEYSGAWRRRPESE